MSSDYQNERLSQIATMLQEKQMTDMRFGMDVTEIQENTGLAIASVYRDLQSNTAKQWGINRTTRNRRPYQYYVDVDELVSHQSYLRQFGEHKIKPQAKAFPNDTAKQALFDFWVELLKQAVNETANADHMLKSFHENMTRVFTPTTISKAWEASDNKPGLGLLLAFSNLGNNDDKN